MESTDAVFHISVTIICSQDLLTQNVKFSANAYICQKNTEGLRNELHLTTKHSVTANNWVLNQTITITHEGTMRL